ncbi:hypothetical protein Tco_1574885, partial [Tanacetum coccineum]
FPVTNFTPNTDQYASSPVKIEAPRELPKYHVDKQCFEIQKKQFLIENDRLLDQIISQDIVNIVMNSSLDINTSVNVNSSVAMDDSVNYVECATSTYKQIYDSIEITDLNAQFQEKVFVITALKMILGNSKEKT